MPDDTRLDLHDNTGLYVLGALSREDAATFETHMDDCRTCAAEVHSLRQITAALPFTVTLVEPPARLRERVLALATSSRTQHLKPLPSPASPRSTMHDTAPPRASRHVTIAWLSAAALALLAVGTGIYAIQLRGRLADVELRLADAMERVRDSETQLARARLDAEGVRERLALLASPDVLDFRLTGLAPARQARGRALLGRSRGLLFAASNLPALPPARVYQLWFLTADAPISAGLVRPNAEGVVTATFDFSQSLPNLTGFAVSIEPEGGVPLPTGALYLATQ